MASVGVGARTDVREDIQGLRAVAVLAVLAFHLDRNWLPGGFLGVDVFFVISGFVITRILLRQPRSPLGWIDFYDRRLRRIVPAYAVLLLVVSLACALLLTERDFAHYESSLRAAALFTSNRYFAAFGEYFAPRSTELPLLHLWSISVEMQFYLLLPLVVLGLPRRWLATSLIAGLAIGATYAAVATSGSKHVAASYFDLSVRVPEFLIGALLAAIPIERRLNAARQRWAAWAGTLLLASGLVFISERAPVLGALSLIPCAGAALLILARQSAPNRVLSLSPMVFTGDISYSVYLWHWPILALTRYYLEVYELTLFTKTVVVLATFFIAYLSYRFVEVPFRARALRRWRGAVALAILGAVGICSILVTPRLNSSVGPKYPAEVLRYADPEMICHGSIVGDCMRGNRSSDREWLVLGDSHAAQLNKFFDVLGSRNGMRARVISASSCVTIPGFDVQRIFDYARKECVEQITQAQRYLEGAKVVVVAGMWQYHAPSEAFWTAFEAFVASMESQGKKVIVFAQIPMLKGDPVRARRFAALGVPNASAKRRDWAEANCRMQELVARHPQAIYFDMTDDPLFRDVPLHNGKLIYFDESHLNEAGAEAYGTAAAQWLVPGAVRTPAAAVPCR